MGYLSCFSTCLYCSKSVFPSSNCKSDFAAKKRISIQGVLYPKTMYVYKSNIADIYAIGCGFITVTNIFSGEYIETLRYEFTAERIG